jgi:serine/threonine-protein kinase
VTDWPDLSSTKYELIEKIGQGGMASVYRARDRELARPVAIKVLSDLHSDPSARARMLEEARIVSRLEHPGVVPVHDSGTLPDGRIYFAMKLVRGRRLDELIESHSSLLDLLAVFERVCQTVAFAHAHGVIHRDLKPQNIMVGPFGEVLVMDWGVAKQMNPIYESDQVSAGAKPGEVPTPNNAAKPRDFNGSQPPSSPKRDQTVPGAVLGTPGYMAPEQVQGDASRVDQRTDIYGLGGVLYFLLARRAPQPGTESASMSVPPRQWNRAVPRPLEAVCMKALAWNPADRYGSAEELIQDIDAFRTHRRVNAYPEGILTPVVRFTSKHRAAIVLILAYLVVRVVMMLAL